MSTSGKSVGKEVPFWVRCSSRFSAIRVEVTVAGVSVNRRNQDDILGDGTVYYDSTNKILTLDNATIEFPNARVDVAGLSAADLTVGADLTVITPDCENAVHGIVCDSSLILVNKATVTVHNGASTKYSSAVRVRGNALMEEGTTLNASVKSGTSGICKGLTVNGDLVLGKDAAMDVSIDDGATDLGECIRVSGLMEIGRGSIVTASAKNAPAIECFGSIEANKDATISVVSDQNDADIFCSGSVVNRGAKIDGEIDAIAGVHNRE